MKAIFFAVGSRLLYGIPVLIVVTMGAAALIDLLPGSPGQAILGDSASAEQVAALNAQLGYDRPFLERYLDWAAGAIRGDFGTSLFSTEPVVETVLRRLAVTAQLAGMALVIALVLSIVLAMASTLRAGRLLDRGLGVISSAVLSIPSFVTVVLVSLIFVVTLQAFPATGWVPPTEDLALNLRYAFLPVLSLAVYETAFFYRVLRNELNGTLAEDYVLVARAKGMTRARIVVRHALRPSLPSLVTVAGLSLGRMLGGAVIVETFFALPGLGAATVSAVGSKDFPMIQAIVTFCVVVYVSIFIVVDLAYAWIDPRVSVR